MSRPGVDNPNKSMWHRTSRYHIFVCSNSLSDICASNQNTWLCFLAPECNYLCLQKFGQVVSTPNSYRGKSLKKKKKKNLYILNSFQGSLKKLTLEDLTQNHTISSSTLAGIHRRRLVLNYFSSATIHGNVTLISGPKDKNPVLISTNTESVQKEENFPLRS